MAKTHVDLFTYGANSRPYQIYHEPGGARPPILCHEPLTGLEPRSRPTEFHRAIFVGLSHLYRGISPVRKTRSWHYWPTFYRGLQPMRIAQPSPFLLPFYRGKTYIYTPIMHRDIGQPFTDAEELPMKLVDESAKDENQGGRD